MISHDLLTELIEHTGDGAYIVDREQRIVAWNRTATDLLGWEAKEVLGRRCYQVLGGQGDGGCVVCRQGCVPFVAGQRGEAVASFDVRVRTRDSHQRWVNVSIIALAAQEQPNESLAVVHLFRDISAKKEAETFAAEVASRARQLRMEPSFPRHWQEESSASFALTPREYQVLELLARGADTNTIASELIIGTSTVRNHIQRILHKLGVHSRLEAVAYAREQSLLD